MKNLNSIQKFYFGQIKSEKLKSLVEASYTFLTMKDTEKLDILISASVCHNDSEAEKALIEMFETEHEKIQGAIDTLEPMTPAEEKEQVKAIDEANIKYQEGIVKIKKIVRTEKESKENKSADQKAFKPESYINFNAEAAIQLAEANGADTLYKYAKMVADNMQKKKGEIV